MCYSLYWISLSRNLAYSFRMGICLDKNLVRFFGGTLMSNGTNPLVELSDSMVEAVSKAGASTVMVNARRRLPASGIAYASDLILTADHVVERDDDITIVLPDGSEVSGVVVGRDPGSDLALLRLESIDAVVANPAEGDARVGQFVLALGRPNKEGIQASLGVVSAIGGPVRTGRGGLLDRYMRTDAIPYPGFSGGPLVDVRGRVVGLNTSGLARGASLVIPVTLAWQIAGVLAEHGRVRRGFLGVRSQPVTISQAQQGALGREQASGLLLVAVEEGSPAAAGGLLVGDIIVALANQPVADPDELLAGLVGDIVSKPTPVQVLRGGELQTITVTIGERRA
jgi:S1-C subfamily serine protease